jgi:hypothetical protein
MNRKTQKPITARSKKLHPQLPFGYQQDPCARSIGSVSMQAFKKYIGKRK